MKRLKDVKIEQLIWGTPFVYAGRLMIHYSRDNDPIVKDKVMVRTIATHNHIFPIHVLDFGTFVTPVQFNNRELR